MGALTRPAAGDYAPYYGTYVELPGDGDILETLAREVERTAALLEGLPPDQETARYEPGKWSVREVVGHLIDTERTFGYRALAFARGDTGPLPGMDQDQWNGVGGAHTVPLAQLVHEMKAVRAATVSQFARMDTAATERRGVASGVEFTVRAFPWIIAGHELHHRRILVERYGVGLGGLD